MITSVATAHSSTPFPAIKPRALALSWDNDIPEYWFDNNPFLTHFMNAFSGVLPQGERFMIDNVRAVRSQIHDNPSLLQDISGFIGQEAHHAKAHTAFNQLLASRGVPLKKLETLMSRIVNLLNKLPEQDRVAVTGAVEHFTAMFGKVTLSHPDMLKNLHPKLQAVFIWHAIEELEHKAVAYDVFVATDGSYLRRIEGVVLATTLISAAILYGQAIFLWQDRSLFKLGSTVKGLWWMFGAGQHAGYFRKVLPEYFAFFRPKFHPWQDDSSALLAQSLPILERLLSTI